jgi:hypothetical protein
MNYMTNQIWFFGNIYITFGTDLSFGKIIIKLFNNAYPHPQPGAGMFHRQGQRAADCNTGRAAARVRLRDRHKAARKAGKRTDNYYP